MYFPYWFFEICGSLHTHLFAESIDCFLYVSVIHFFHIPDNWNNKTLQRGNRPFFQQNRQQICTYKIDTNSSRPLKITKRWSSRNSEFWKEYSCSKLVLFHFIISSLRSFVILAIWLALSRATSSQITLFLALNHICSKSRYFCTSSHHFCFKSHHSCTIWYRSILFRIQNEM